MVILIRNEHIHYHGTGPTGLEEPTGKEGPTGLEHLFE